MKVSIAASLAADTLGRIDPTAPGVWSAHPSAPSLRRPYEVWWDYYALTELMRGPVGGAPPRIVLAESDLPSGRIDRPAWATDRYDLSTANLGPLPLLGSVREALMEALHRTGTWQLLTVAADAADRAAAPGGSGLAASKSLRRAAAEYREWADRAAAALEHIPDVWAADLFALEDSLKAAGTAATYVPIYLR